MTRRILGSWESFDLYFERSLVFCIVHSNRIIAVILGTAKFNEIIPIDIETEEVHRNKGLELILTKKFVKECIRKGLTPQWD